MKAVCPDLVTGSWCEAAAGSEGLEHVGTAAAPVEQPGQGLRNAGDVLRWSEPGGNIYLYAPLEALAGAQLCCVCAVEVQLAVSWEPALGREQRLLVASSHVTGPNAPPRPLVPCSSSALMTVSCGHSGQTWAAGSCFVWSCCCAL